MPETQSNSSSHAQNRWVRCWAQVLFQLPPKWKVNIERLDEFLSVLPKRHKYTIEFRDESWYTPQVYELLGSRGVALCIHDWRDMSRPRELTAVFTYIRFHGSGRKYGGDYPEPQLRQWADPDSNLARAALRSLRVFQQ
jgi:uncharacterized protein YecE (DUF72 family)